MADLMMENILPLTMRAGCGTAMQRSVAESTAYTSTGITVYIERLSTNDGKRVLTQAVLNGSTSISELKLTGRQRGFWKEGEKLVLGGRELLDHQVLDQLPRGKPGHLHIYVKLSDITSLSLKDSCGNDRTFVSPRSPLKSALTAALANGPHAPNSRSLVVRGQFLEENTPLDLEHVQKEGDDVLHLVVRRPKVNYSIKMDSFELSITANDDVKSIKEKVEMQQGLPADSHSLLWNGQCLAAQKSLASYGVGDGHVLELVPIQPVNPTKMPPSSPVLSSPKHQLYEGWLKARAGLAAGKTPKLSTAGTGGSYFLQDEGGINTAVLKPADEEPLAAHNPKGHSSYGTEGFRKGVMPGEGAVREVAAYLLDHDHFSGVPPTALVSCQNFSLPGHIQEAKIGSLQAFVSSDGDCEERGCGIFDVEEVHKIAILDIRLGNCDRNGSNILVKKCSGAMACKWQLIPIDHGYCLPSSFADINFEWMYWPQSAKKFSEKSKSYIASLSVEKDEEILKAHGLYLRADCHLVRKVGTMLLKKAASKDLSPGAIAEIMCRETLQKSRLEKLHASVIASCENPREATGDTDYLNKLSEALDLLLDDLGRPRE